MRGATMTATKDGHVTIVNDDGTEQTTVYFKGPGKGFDIQHTVYNRDGEAMAFENMPLPADVAVKIAVFVMSMSS